jgi:hypothetical protein
MRSPSVTTMIRRVWPIAQQLGDTPPVIGANENAARSLEDVAEPLASEPHCRGIDDWLNLLDVVAYHAEEQGLVPVVQRVERHVLIQIGGQAPQVGQHSFCLLLHRKHVRRQQPTQAKSLAFLLGESGALVEKRIAQQRYAVRISRGRRMNAPRLRLVHRFPPSQGALVGSVQPSVEESLDGDQCRARCSCRELQPH